MITLAQFAEQKLSDPVAYSILKQEAIMLAKDALDGDIKQAIIDKITKGEKEHNQHLTRKQWLEEYHDEHLDLIGYLLVRDYYNEEGLWRE